MPLTCTSLAAAAAGLLPLSYCQAQRHTEAAKLLVDTAAQLAAQKAPPLQIKKLYVLAALEVEAFRKKALAVAGSNGATAAATLLGTGASATRGAGRTVAATGMPTQTAAAAQTLAGDRFGRSVPPICVCLACVTGHY